MDKPNPITKPRGPRRNSKILNNLPLCVLGAETSSPFHYRGLFHGFKYPRYNGQNVMSKRYVPPKHICEVLFIRS